jgi:hypothetical protein
MNEKCVSQRDGNFYGWLRISRRDVRSRSDRDESEVTMLMTITIWSWWKTEGFGPEHDSEKARPEFDPAFGMRSCFRPLRRMMRSASSRVDGQGAGNSDTERTCAPRLLKRICAWPAARPEIPGRCRNQDIVATCRCACSNRTAWRCVRSGSYSIRRFSSSLAQPDGLTRLYLQLNCLIF